MPAVSKAQSRFLHARFGAGWVKARGFDNPTEHLPAYKRPAGRHVLKHVYGLKSN